MERHLLAEAAELVERANDLVKRANSRGARSYTAGDAKALLGEYARLVKLGSFGEAAVGRLVGDPAELARVCGTSIGRARQTLETAQQIDRTPKLGAALRAGEVSMDQAHEIAKTEALCPGSADRLLETARGGGSFHVLRNDARKLRLEAQAGAGLGERHHQARYLHHRVTDLGMIHIEAQLEPHIGVPIVNRLEAHARRLAESARRAGNPEPFGRHLADSLPRVFSSEGKGSGRTEMVVLVSYEVGERGWSHVEDDEFCKIPGVGPVDPQIAKQIAEDAFLSGVFYDGKDLRHIRRWTRGLPAAVRTALNLGDPPGFDGVKCVDCGNRFWIEWDHQQPHAAGGPTSVEDSRPRCWRCHRRKTAEDWKAGKLRRTRAVANAPP